jgi:hypothetical protein
MGIQPEESTLLATVNECTLLLVSCWRLASSDPRVPTSSGLLDRALKASFDRGAFPVQFREALHFVDAPTGIRCVELPDMLACAHRALLTRFSNPAYQYAEVALSEGVARALLRRIGISAEDGKAWGGVLVNCLEGAERGAGHPGEGSPSGDSAPSDPGTGKRAAR